MQAGRPGNHKPDLSRALAQQENTSHGFMLVLSNALCINKENICGIQISQKIIQKLLFQVFNYRKMTFFEPILQPCLCHAL
jgi:hypothetical protein